MRVGQTVPHQHQALPLTTESLADQGLSFLRYQSNLVFAFQGQVFNALTVLGLGPALQALAGRRFMPNAANRPIELGYDSLVVLYTEAGRVYQAACEQYLKDEEDAKQRAADLFASRRTDPQSSLDEDLT